MGLINAGYLQTNINPGLCPPSSWVGPLVIEQVGVYEAGAGQGAEEVKWLFLWVSNMVVDNVRAQSSSQPYAMSAYAPVAHTLQ